MNPRAPDSDAAFVERVMGDVHRLPDPACSISSWFGPRKNFSINGLTALVVLALALALLVPAVLQTQAASRRTILCQQNLRLIGQAINVYAEDHDDRLPPVSGWGSALASFRDAQVHSHCPEDLGPMPGYSLTRMMAGRPRADFSSLDTPVVFESWAGRFTRRHVGRGNVYFLDGSVRLMGILPN